MFTQPAFINKNTPELREKLEELGYRVLPDIFNSPCLSTCLYGYAVPTDNHNLGGGIDCGVNEELFLAIAALRSDSDYRQFFRITDLTTGNVGTPVRLAYGKRACKSRFLLLKNHDYLIEKLTPNELINHFTGR